MLDSAGGQRVLADVNGGTLTGTDWYRAVAGVTSRQVACYVISTIAPGSATAPIGTVWFQT
jgi:hypothetical protein